MSIPLTGTAGLFTRLGKGGAVVGGVNSWRGYGALVVSTISGSGATITVTTFKTHGFSAGDTVFITGSNIAGYNGSFTIAAITSTTVFTITNATTGSNTSTNVQVYKTLGAGLFSSSPLLDNWQAQYQVAPTGTSLPINQQLIDGLYSQKAAYIPVHASLNSYVQTVAQQTLIKMANDDTKLASQDVPTAMALLVTQMTTGAQSVQKPTITITSTAGSNSGGEICVAGVLGPNGLQQDYVIAETLNVKCTFDSQAGAVVGNETFQCLGATQESDPLMWDWPLGSGANQTFSAVNPQTTGTGNLLNDSSFATFVNTPNLPDQWTLGTGTLGTTILTGGAGNSYTGVNCVEFVGNGAELTSILQKFGVSTGTTTTLLPSTIYSVAGWAKVSATPGAGVLALELVDGNNNIIQNAQGANNQITLALTSISTTYTPFSGFFETPAVLPAVQQFRVRLSTALSNAINLFIGQVAMAVPLQVYAGGPFLTVFSGQPKAILNDSFSVVVTNQYNSQWQLLAQKLFNMTGINQQLPSSNSPTILDSLIA